MLGAGRRAQGGGASSQHHRQRLFLPLPLLLPPGSLQGLARGRVPVAAMRQDWRGEAGVRQRAAPQGSCRLWRPRPRCQGSLQRGRKPQPRGHGAVAWVNAPRHECLLLLLLLLLRVGVGVGVLRLQAGGGEDAGRGEKAGGARGVKVVGIVGARVGTSQGQGRGWQGRPGRGCARAPCRGSSSRG